MIILNPTTDEKKVMSINSELKGTMVELRNGSSRIFYRFDEINDLASIHSSTDKSVVYTTVACAKAHMMAAQGY